MKEKSLGERIYTLREEKKLSQDELAEQLGVSRQTISNWENDKVKLTLQNATGLCEAFGMSMDEFLGNSTPPAKRSKKKRLALILCAVATLIVGIFTAIFAFSSENEASSTITLTKTGGFLLCALLCLGLATLLLALSFRKK